MFGGVGAIPGAIGGAVIGGILAALGKTAPQVKNISVNAQDTVSQLSDLLKAIPRDRTSEYDFVFDFIQETNKLAQLASNYDGVIGQLVSDTTKPQQQDAETSNQLTSTFLAQIAKVEDYIAKFRVKVSTGVYKSFVSHSKVMAPVYMFIDDDVEDVEKSCQSLEAAIKEHDAAIQKVKQAVSTSLETPKSQQEPSEYQNVPYKKEVEQISPEAKSYAGIFRALNIGSPNEKQVSFLKDLMVEQ